MRQTWTNKELDELEDLLRRDKHTKEIAVLLDRTEDSVASAIRRHCPLDISTPDPIKQVKAKRDTKLEKAAEKNLLELLEVEREKNSFLQKLTKPGKPLTIPAREHGKVREMTALVLASDWHVEEEIKPVKVQGRNKYTLDIADLRIKRFFQGIVDLIEHHRASGKVVIRDLVLWLGGDLLTGYIHEEMMITSKLSPIEAILWLHPRIKAGIELLLQHLDNIVIPCDVGNHGRTTKFRHITTGPETSYEYGMYCQLARDFETDPRVTFDTSPANDHYVRIYDYVLHTTHGDSLRYAGGVGGLTVPLLKAVSTWDTDITADWHAIGHFHTALDIDKAIANGSLIGWGAYSKWIKCRYNPRDLSQHFSLIDKDKGRCHSTPIWVSKFEEEKKFWTKEELSFRR